MGEIETDAGSVVGARTCPESVPQGDVTTSLHPQRAMSVGRVSVAYGYEITTHRLRSPIGDVYHFAAKIRRLPESDDGVRWRPRLPFDEAWGETENEARQKAEAMIARLVRD